MSIHDQSIDKLLEAMPQGKRKQLRQRILKLIDAFNQGDPPPGGNVRSLQETRNKKHNGVVQLIR